MPPLPFSLSLVLGQMCSSLFSPCHVLHGLQLRPRTFPTLLVCRRVGIELENTSTSSTVQQSRIRTQLGPHTQHPQHQLDRSNDQDTTPITWNRDHPTTTQSTIPHHTPLFSSHDRQNNSKTPSPRFRTVFDPLHTSHSYFERHSSDFLARHNSTPASNARRFVHLAIRDRSFRVKISSDVTATVTNLFRYENIWKTLISRTK